MRNSAHILAILALLLIHISACKVTINPVARINVKDSLSNDIVNGSGIYYFGSTLINSAQTKMFTVQNNGKTYLQLNGSPMVFIAGSDASTFPLTLQPTSPIKPKASTTFAIKFMPIVTRTYSATVSIGNNDSDKNPYTFLIIGNGTTPEISIKDSSDRNIANNTGSFDFGKIAENKSRTETFTILNTGTADLLLAGSPKVYISGSDASEFSVTAQPASPILPDDSTTFSIKFHPKSEGIKTISVLITNNDIDENSYTFSVSGFCTYYSWTKRIGDSEDDIGYSITTDSSGNVYIAGVFKGSVNFGADFGISDIRTSSETSDNFVTKITSNGTYGWTRQIGGPYSCYQVAITIDSSGNIYLTGRFGRTVNFGADFGVSDIKISAGSVDIFVTKITSSGSYGWTKRLGGASHDDARTITTDTSGNIYLAGFFYDTINFGYDFGVSDIKSPLDRYDGFITKINSNGSYGWTRRIGGYEGDRINSITTDSSGNVYLTGSFGGTVNFGIDFGISDSKTSAGSTDIFVTKITSSGSYCWTKRLGGTIHDYGYSITIDLSENVYVTGIFMGTVDFGEDFGISDIKAAIPSGSYNIFVTKITSSGSYCWTRRIKGYLHFYCRTIKTDSEGNVFVAGLFYQTVNFGEDFGVSDIKTSAGRSDIFLTKMTTNGSYMWTKRIGGDSIDTVASIAIDSSGNIYLTGDFRETVDFGADFGVSDSKTSRGKSDIFITKLTQ